MSCPASLRVLGLPAQASKAEVKAAFLLLAKQWHPDRHSGPNKALAESKFKSIAEAYERLSQEHVAEAASSHPTGPGRHAQGSGTRSYGPRASAYESWGTKEQYGPAHHSRYDPFVGYMDFSANTPAGEARARTEARQRQRMRASLVIFLLGLGTAVYSHRSDQRRRENGELVDAFYNNATRRWEKATPAMMRDPLLSTLVHLKPPGMVYGHGLKGNGGVHGQPARKQAQTLDGQKIGDAYRARAQGTRG